MIGLPGLQRELALVQEELMRMIVEGEEDTLAFHRLYAVFQTLAWVDDPLHFSGPFEKVRARKSGGAVLHAKAGVKLN